MQAAVAQAHHQCMHYGTYANWYHLAIGDRSSMHAMPLIMNGTWIHMYTCKLKKPIHPESYMNVE